jgi:hypothetical protein
MVRAVPCWLLVLALLGAALPARAAELSGVRMPDRLQVAGQELVLNGLGLRKFALFKIYVAGLYLAAPARDAAAVLTSTTPRALRMELMRDVDRGRFTGGLRDGLQRNGGSRLATHQVQADRLLALFGDVRKGTVVQFADAASGGVSVAIGGEEKAVLGDRAFADLVFAIWLGPVQPSADLQKGLLGR